MVVLDLIRISYLAPAHRLDAAQEEALEDQADAVEDAGEAREEAIDDSDVDTDELSNAQKEGMVNGQ